MSATEERWARLYVGRFSEHVPFAPLLDISEMSVQSMAKKLGIDRSTIHRWQRNGIPTITADALAVSLGFHPMEVWGWDWMDASIREQAARPERWRRRHGLEVEA